MYKYVNRIRQDAHDWVDTLTGYCAEVCIYVLLCNVCCIVNVCNMNECYRVHIYMYICI